LQYRGSADLMHGIPAIQRALLGRILSIYHPESSRKLLGGIPLRRAGLTGVVDYLERVVGALQLFVPASRPEFGITERGGDAVISYLGGCQPAEHGFFLMLDVSGFTALLTFLTDRFGKQEAGDIMNLGILNRYCLNRIGVLLHHFASGAEGRLDSPGEAALKTALSFRALLGRVTREVREELGRKLAGKPHQDRISPFIQTLEIKASGCVVAAAAGGSDFYGKSHRVRITWGETARLISAAEKLGGNDEPVAKGLAEFKGIGLDKPALQSLNKLVECGWLGKDDFALKKFGSFHKLVLTPAGCSLLAGKVEHLFEGRTEQGGKPAVDPGEPPGALQQRLRQAAQSLDALVPLLYSEEFIELTVRNLGPNGDTSMLFDERSSRIHDTGILFINFIVEEEKMLDELAEQVHQVMSRYGLMYKYNIFPEGDFNLMATLGLELRGAPETDRFYAEVLWQCWRDLLRTTEKKFGSRVSLRAGMSVGKCLQGPVGDNLIHNEHTVIGPDCNLAARLVAKSLERRGGSFVFDSGTLVVTPAGYRPLSHLVQPTEPFTRAALKGFSEPLPLYSLAARLANESIEDYTSRLRQLPLVTVEGRLVDKVSRMDRDSFLGSCRKVLEAVEGGRNTRTALLAFYGRSGLGKTRRMAELMAWCCSRGWPVLFGECFSWYQEARSKGGNGQKRGGASAAVPYHPFVRLLAEQVFGITPRDDRSRAMTKIADRLSRLPDSLGAVQQAPIIASFLGLADQQEFPESLAPEARRNIFFERVADLIESLISASGKGLLLCMDDLQWADTGTLRLLKFLRQRVEDGLVVCVNARKPGQLEVLTGKLSGRVKEAENLFQVSPLEPSAVELLTRVALGLDLKAGLPEPLIDRVKRNLESTPFFIIEFCGKLLEKEIAYVRDGRLLRLDEEQLRRLGLPNRIQSIIESRVESLPRRDFDLVRYGSVLGGVLRCKHVATLVKTLEKESSLPLDQVQEALHRLSGLQILRIEQDRGPDSVYSFSRALIAESLYQGLPPTLRKKLHAAAAEIFEQSADLSPLECALSAAMHYDLAERPAPACSLFLSAAGRAARLFENEKSIELADKVEKICTDHRIESWKKLMLEAHLLRGEAALGLGRFTQVLEDSAEARSLASRLRQPESGIRAAMLTGRTYLTRAQREDFSLALRQFREAEKRAAAAKKESLQIEAAEQKARVLMEMGRTKRALAETERLLEAFEAKQSGELPENREKALRTASLLRTLGSVLHRCGKNREALPVYDRALKIVDATGGEDGKLLKANLLNSKALALAASFRLDKALEVYALAKSAARQVGDVSLQLIILNNMSVALNDSGRNAEALDLLLSRYKGLRELAGENRTLAAYEFNIGESYHFMEQYEQAEYHYRRSLEIADSIGSRQFAVNNIYNLGEALRDQGRDQEARTVMSKGLRIARRSGYFQQEMDLENTLGEMERYHGRLAQAVRRHRRCVKIAEKLGDKFGHSWSLRNLAVDYLLLPNITKRRAAEAGGMLFKALRLARKSQQPENIMESLSRLLEFRSLVCPQPARWRPLLIELKKMAEEQNSEKYRKLCLRFEAGLTSAKGKRDR